jgi:two-component sensor histidine kinase
LFTPDDREAGVPAQELATARAQGHAPDQRWHIRKSGERFWVDGSTWPLRHPNGEEIGFLKIGRDDTVRRKAELLLQEAAERQEMITREVGHRVKNNLAIVTSLLSLQARNTANEETRAALSDARTRIEAIAQVHDQLWRQDQAETIDLDAFLRDLCAKVQEAVPHHRIDYEGEPVTVGIDRAVSISLLVNELITNAVKYAYPDTEGGPIRVSLRPAGADCLRLEVSDRGRGMPENIVTGASEGSFGTKLLRTFARQLDASLDIDSHAHGTRLTLIIPVRPGVSCQA